MPNRRLVIAGTHSGVGKTTVALALMAALRRRGLTVQPFKVGPDFIDPGHHTAVCGRVSRNLDTWMLAEDTVRTIFGSASAGADISIIEGVMGLFDGRSAEDPRGSSAHLAKLLDAAVLLVVDAEAIAASVAALVKGFAEFDPAVRIVAVLCNRVAGAKHYDYLETALRRHTSVIPVGWLPRRPEWHIPERHLGLVTQEEFEGERHRGDAERRTASVSERPGPLPYGRGSACHLRLCGEKLFDQLALALEETVNLDLLLQLAECHAVTWSPGHLVTPSSRHSVTPSLQVAVARDAAFCFYYQDNLDLLQGRGARLTFFSPLHDASLPEGVDLVYLGGGYPEVHAERLASNQSMLSSLRRYHQKGGAIYAECGGLMYCCRGLVDAEGRAFPMLDLLPARTVMQERRAALGYVTWRATEDTLLGPPGTKVRGHEFHYSRLEPLARLEPRAMLQRDGEEPKPDGFVRGRLLAGYAHLHFASNPDVVPALLSWAMRR